MGNQLEVFIGKQKAEVENISEFPITISYKLENAENFQQKTSDQSLDVLFPDTIQNAKIANNFKNPAVEDLTPGQYYRNHRAAKILVNDNLLLDGKAFLQGSKDGYEYSFYGGNAGWIIDLKDKTLFDFLKHITFEFTKDNMVNSWTFDGNHEDLPYVFAPVKYRGFTDIDNQNNSQFSTTYLRPALSVYWLLYWGFKSLGYRISSEFMDLPFFRRLTMPWTWGNFLDSDGTLLQTHKFLAKSTTENIWFNSFNGTPDLLVTNDSTDGAYDNNDDYTFNPLKHMEFEYKTPYFGTLEATVSCQLFYDATIVGASSFIVYRLQWYHVPVSTGVAVLMHTDTILNANGNNLRRKDEVAIVTKFFTQRIENGDKIICEPYLRVFEGKGIGARANIETHIIAFQLEYFRIPLGGTINFENYTGLKNYKFLDFLAGVCDSFDISMCTDPITKVVTLEPTHPYEINGTKYLGYFNQQTVSWTDKKDITKDWDLQLFADYERTLLFKYKEDSADGILKKIQDRNKNTISLAKYLLPERFKAEKKEVTNRFFAATMHWNNPNFKDITGLEPQMICIVPENISNTSNAESGNIFQPKLAYYKGEVTEAGGWIYDGDEYSSIPYMFAVNYRDQNDPNLNYNDERMDDNSVNVGLLKKFFWPRLAIMRNGQYYKNADFHLNNNDVSRIGHREYKIVDGIRYELVEISNYMPLKENSTGCYLRKYEPVKEIDLNNTFPSADALIVPVIPLSDEDIKYVQAKCLASDI